MSVGFWLGASAGVCFLASGALALLLGLGLVRDWWRERRSGRRFFFRARRDERLAQVLLFPPRRLEARAALKEVPPRRLGASGGVITERGRDGRQRS